MPWQGCEPRLIRATSQSITAPEISLIVVKLAASMLVCFRAARHSNELHANAIMASDVRATTRAYDISFLQERCTRAPNG
ncbi:MAG TPA: hypothetical protein VMT12_05755 [Syntrophales bacterium]|nr:hypothetical protein [Syntrophales bacterium]